MADQNQRDLLIKTINKIGQEINLSNKDPKNIQKINDNISLINSDIITNPQIKEETISALLEIFSTIKEIIVEATANGWDGK